MGLFLSILFASVALAGEKIAASGGLGFAAQVDPNTGGQTPVISNILTLFLVVTFLSLDGHLALIRAISQSYVFLPFGGSIPLISTSEYGIDAAGQMFHIATVIMLPIVALLLLTNFCYWCYYPFCASIELILLWFSNDFNGCFCCALFVRNASWVCHARGFRIQS